MCDETLHFLAVADAHHDFDKAAKTSDILNGLNDPDCYTPETGDTTIENQTLDKIIGYSDINSLVDDLKGKKIAIDVNTHNYTVHLLKTTIQKKYSKVIITDIRKMIGSLKDDEFTEFLGNTRLNAIVDSATNINVLRLFNNTFRGIHINYILNREVINDSGGLPTTDKLEGIDQLVDTDDSIKLYGTKSKFNTKYRLSLSKPEFLHTDFTIKENGVVKYHSRNRSENTIEECLKKLRNKKCDRSVIYQVKRSGDWLQALSCLDLEREYNDSTSELRGVPITLVTHDIILLCYCLYLGINVLFSRKVDGILIHFKVNTNIESNNETNENNGSDSEMPDNDETENEESDELTNKESDYKFWRSHVIDMLNADYFIFINGIHVTGSTREDTINNFFNLKRIYPNKSINFTRSPILINGELINYGLSDKAIKKMLEEAIILDNIVKIDDEILTGSKTYIKNRAIDAFNRTGHIIHIDRVQRGGNRNSIDNCKSYLIELYEGLSCFESEDNPDYEYYENVAFIILACLNEYKASSDVYEIMQAIIFDILPSVQGYIRTEESDIIQFFKDDKYTADCTAFAARNVALHSLGLWSGPIESLGNREKHSVKIPPSAVEYFDKIKKHLETSDFDERRGFLVEQLKQYHSQPVSKPRVNSKSKTRSVRMTPQPRMVTVSGGRKYVTRRKRK
jgi:hypothetical protein